MAPLVAMAEIQPRCIRSMSSGPRPSLTTCAPMPQMIGLFFWRACAQQVGEFAQVPGGQVGRQGVDERAEVGAGETGLGKVLQVDQRAALLDGDGLQLFLVQRPVLRIGHGYFLGVAAEADDVLGAAVDGQEDGDVQDHGAQQVQIVGEGQLAVDDQDGQGDDLEGGLELGRDGGRERGVVDQVIKAEGGDEESRAG